MPIDNLEIEIRKSSNEGYSFFSEYDGKKRTYTIHSPELKRKLREIIFPFGSFGKGSVKYKGENSYGDCIFYFQGKVDEPSRLMLISREIVENQETICESEFQEFEKELRRSENEMKKREEASKKKISELELLPEDIASSYRT